MQFRNGMEQKNQRLKESCGKAEANCSVLQFASVLQTGWINSCQKKYKFL